MWPSHGPLDSLAMPAETLPGKRKGVATVQLPDGADIKEIPFSYSSQTPSPDEPVNQGATAQGEMSSCPQNKTRTSFCVGGKG